MDITIDISLLLGLIIVILISLLIKRGSKSENSLKSTIPGMKPTDADLGNIPDIQESGSLHQFLSKLHSKYGDIAGFWFGKSYHVSLANGRLFKHAQTLFDRPPELVEFFEPLVTSKALEYVNGEEGRRRHKILAESFSEIRSSGLQKDLEQICNDFADKLDVSKPVPMFESMMMLSVKIITKLHFGAYFRDDNGIEDFYRQYEIVWDEMEAKLGGDFTDDQIERNKNFEDALRKFHKTCRHIIKVQKDARKQGDYEKAPFLDTLLDNYDDKEDEEFADLVLFMVAGFHTTGSALSWLFHYVSLNEDIQQKLFEEIDSANGSKLSYVRNVIDETLRLSCLVPFCAHVNNDSDINIGDKIIPQGTPIVFAQGVSHQCDKRAFPDPLKFDPDRFDRVSSPGLSFLPFGPGPRRCPGYPFAYQVMTAVVACLMSRYHFEPSTEDRENEVQHRYGLVTKPNSMLYMNLTRRINSAQ